MWISIFLLGCVWISKNVFISIFLLGCVYSCSSALLFCLVRTKRENNIFGPGPLSIHTGSFDNEPKDTEPNGIVICSQPYWSGWMTYIDRTYRIPQTVCSALRRLIGVWNVWMYVVHEFESHQSSFGSRPRPIFLVVSVLLFGTHLGLDGSVHTDSNDPQ